MADLAETLVEVKKVKLDCCGNNGFVADEEWSVAQQRGYAASHPIALNIDGLGNSRSCYQDYQC